MVNQYRNLAAGLRQPHRSYSGTAGRFLQGRGRAGNAVGTEEFQAAGAPAGRRYFSTVNARGPEPHSEVIDIVSDGASRPVRVRIDTGSHAILLAPGGGSLSGTWTGIQCRSSGDRTCTATISLLRSARLPPIGWGAPRTFEVLYLEPVTCLPRRERQRQELLGRRRSPRRFGRFSARRWRYTALRTGWTRSLWVAGDLEVSYEGLFELRRKSRGRAGRSRARAGGERPPCWRPS